MAGGSAPTGAGKARGEVQELSASLQNLCTSGKRSDKELRTAKTDVFKKVISYMSLGMDMSALFPGMCSCANLSPDDLVLKKMLYLYLGHYATQTPDLALLTMNQLHKDCVDTDPTIRGLALRTLCSLRVPNFLEYVLEPINAGLSDRHAYVRRTAVMGVLKVYHIDTSVVLNHGMLERVSSMLYSDVDAQVVANCVAILMQVEGCKKLANKRLVYHLLNRIKDFSDWSQCQVLELTAAYHPTDEAEVYDILNVLEDRLSHANSAVVLGAIKVFLHHTLSMTATHQQVLERIKDPLKSLISRDDPAIVYAVLAHVLLLVQRAPFVFEADYVAFYCRTHDPGYVKKLKMEVLSSIAAPANVYEIVGELSEYARDISPAMAREAVRAVGRIALLVPDVSGIVERLLLFLESGSDHIMAETLVQMKDVLRRYPDVADVCVVQLGEIHPASINEPHAKAALIWILGQFGQSLQDAPYQLEALLDSWSGEAPCVRLALLSSAMQLFCKRPPEAQRLLCGSLAAGLNDGHQDVHDRALLYYRLLRVDPGEACRVAAPPLMAVNFFTESTTQEMKDTIFEEFNSLSVVYGAPASSFVERAAYHSLDAEEITDQADVRPDMLAAEAPELLGDVATNLLGDVEADLLDLDAGSAAPPGAASYAPTAVISSGGSAPVSTSSSALDLLADVYGGPPAHSQQQQRSPGTVPRSQPLQQARPSPVNHTDDLLGDGFGFSSSTPAGPPELQLNPQARLSAGDFQAAWKALPVGITYSESLSRATLSAIPANNHKDFCAHMAQAYIHNMANGGQPPTFKYYFYSITSDTSSLLLAEVVVRTDTATAAVTLKAQAPQLLSQFAELWRACMTGFYR